MTKPKKKEVSLLAIAEELQATLKIDKKPDPKGTEDYLKKYILKAAANLWPEDVISDDAKTILASLEFDIDAQYEKVRAEREEKEKEEAAEKPAKNKKPEKAAKAPKEKKEKAPVDYSKSNKAVVYKAWKAGTKDPEKLHKKVNEAVKLNTITAWLKMWEKGQGLPAIAKEKA